MRGTTAKRTNTTMKNAEATNTTETVAVAEQGAQGAPEKVTSKKAASQKKSVPKDQTAAKGKKAAKPAKEPATPRPASKGAKVLEMIGRAKGATLAELMQVTGWQAHSIRGFISGNLSKKMGLTVESAKREDGERVYQLCGAPHKLYVRSPAAFFEDSIVSPPLLPRMETKPRTVCFCQPVSSMISASVTPLARFIIAITSAFLLVRSPLSALFLAGAAFACPAFACPAFAGAAFLAGLAFFAGFAPLAGFLGLASWVGFVGLASGSLGCALPASRRIAGQTRATAFLRSANLVTGVLPGMLFQVPPRITRCSPLSAPWGSIKASAHNWIR